MLTNRAFRGFTATATAGRRSYSSVISGVHRMAELRKIKSWVGVNGKDAIFKTFKFNDFRQAWHFMSTIAAYADQVNHHPEWLNVYNRVEVTLTTHDVQGLSAKDIKMAEQMDILYNRIMSGKETIEPITAPGSREEPVPIRSEPEL